MLESEESTQIAALVKRAVLHYRHEIDFGRWKLRYLPPEYDQETDREIGHPGVSIFIPEGAHHAGGTVPTGGEWTVLCEEAGLERALRRYLDTIEPGERKEIAAALRAKVAIPWMVPTKEFGVTVQHHGIDGALATIRMHPTNVCLATITGIDAATEDINADVADRLGAAWNVCAGLSTEDLILISRSGAGRGQLKLLIEGLKAVARGDEIVESKVMAASVLAVTADIDPHVDAPATIKPERERG